MGICLFPGAAAEFDALQHAGGVAWDIRSAHEEGLKLLGMNGHRLFTGRIWSLLHSVFPHHGGAPELNI